MSEPRYQYDPEDQEEIQEVPEEDYSAKTAYGMTCTALSLLILTLLIIGLVAMLSGPGFPPPVPKIYFALLLTVMAVIIHWALERLSMASAGTVRLVCSRCGRKYERNGTYNCQCGFMGGKEIDVIKKPCENCGAWASFLICEKCGHGIKIWGHGRREGDDQWVSRTVRVTPKPRPRPR
jgi:hypothetical protein